ncbi:MAG: hypothetical protein HUJ31_06925 [Pseudomonadales bacterium]|nr:hypothetical protein [Pseudomonadales bacterium]
MSIRNLYFTLMLLVPLAGAAAETKPCSMPEHRQFDFWLGKWTAFSKDGDRQGENHLHQIMDGCAVQENWKSARGPYRGTSYNFYDAVSDKWYQTWVDNRGGHLFLKGGWNGTSMQLSGSRTTAEGNSVIDRITWTPLDDGRVRQHWQASEDGGETWKEVFDGYYEREDGEN